MANHLISYDRDKILGRGANGTIVYKGKLATENGSQEQVAVKRIQKEYLSSKMHSKKYEDRELSHQLKLGKHPNVVRLLHWEDHGEDFRCYALELCDFSLNKSFKDPERYQYLLPSQIDFMLQLLLGLEYIHSQNLIHRDIKPENVLISKSSDGHPLVKWGDFGLSKAIQREQCTMSGEKGTYCYWAPEIWKMWKNCLLDEKNADKKVMTIMSDIFSTGCVFFKFCTNGVHPFGDDEMQIKNNLSIEPSNPYHLKALVLKESHFAYKIIKRMLENEPKARPNLREIMSALLALQKLVGMHCNWKNCENQQMKQNEQAFSRGLHAICDATKVDKTADIDEAQQKLEKMKIELHILCSNAKPTKEQIQKIAGIAADDSCGLVNVVDDDGLSPLLLICRNNRSKKLIKCIKALLRTSPKTDTNELGFKVDVNYQDRSGYTALHYICRFYQGDDFLEIFDLLYQHGIDVNKTEKEWEDNALQLFFIDNIGGTGVVPIVKAFIKYGINLKHKNKIEFTLLHHLCRYYTHENLIEIAKLLIANGVDVTAKGCNGWTALHQLCRFYNHTKLIESLKLLIAHGAEVNTNVYDGFTPLHHLCRHYSHDNLIDVAELLIGKGIQVTTLDSDGWTVLHVLCRYNTHANLIEVIKLILNNDGIDVIKQVCDGWTLLQNLCRRYTHDNMFDIVKLLIENGASVTEKGDGGWTSLHQLCRYYKHDNLFNIVNLLIENGADVNAETSDGWTPLHNLCRHYSYTNLIALIKLLIANGADVRVKTQNGKTAFDLLLHSSVYKHKNRPQILKLLKH